MATDLGKVGIVLKGDWSNSETYEVLDSVSYNGGLYIAKQAVPAGTAPTNTTYWQVAFAPQYVTFFVYKEPTFTNGYAEVDISSNLALSGLTRAANPIVQISGSAAGASGNIRSCDVKSDGVTIKIAMTSSSYNGTIGCFIICKGT